MAWKKRFRKQRLVTWQFGRIAMEGRVENLSRVRATHTGGGRQGHLSGTAVVRRYQYPFCRIMFMPVRRQRKISELRVTEM